MNTLESCHLCENCASVNESKLRLLKEREIAFNNFRELNEFSNSLGHFFGMVGSPTWKAQLSKLVSFYNEHNPPSIKEIPVATISTKFEINSLEIDELFRLLKS